MPNYTGIQPVRKFGDIHTAIKAGFIDRLKDNYTKRRLIAMFQIKGNYLLLKEIIIIYFSMYCKVLVYEERFLGEALNTEMNGILSLIELDGREVIVRLCEPYQLVRNDILSRKIPSINSEFEMNGREIINNRDEIKNSISKVTEWLMDLETNKVDEMVSKREYIVNENYDDNYIYIDCGISNN
ncbi:uncharacterized protein OCT59_015304 [Rhizophagus irregularis]|uniref:Uncharacterized protein n=3 Tax=Rhizophagus irregularis TaxID=588596 RepID=A0A915YYW0_9GLOM|nr:hypothetical protein GLOIN_2v964220 [Rhizophagus irregularis DAOM 181602=DAOM 197198]EXX74813.1 hypothetical protein RirG_047550 [Rhizophagus irregularis DAOM 197198w]UZO22958.1 hypothetical protein OCT59_015304 [Rhizophagus irregularis]POG82147.1 hypothetical protein GLOIN_2v964220 [Rhizophagus irregularis DAOM 181602=DAOM 197198]CAB4463104.1 unnamed protein product [Rhizophagus irregularis]CAB5209502.1 unnamed protein product [Rhizophagus irregularis]|eukprot:XP_025189013.1 hypothetical protein GLOIN_2v964220 [Rhizophagus irregularis DAOM 181602=DAOM 197198]